MKCIKFKDYCKLQNISIAEGVTEKDFITAVKSYSSIDDAMLGLDDKFIEWYLLNVNSKSLNRALRKLKINLHETSNILEDDITLGYAPSNDKITKNIKYKGQYITLEYDRELGSWFPAIRFRSIITALKYIKSQVDYSVNNV